MKKLIVFALAGLLVGLALGIASAWLRRPAQAATLAAADTTQAAPVDSADGAPGAGPDAVQVLADSLHAAQADSTAPVPPDSAAAPSDTAGAAAPAAMPATGTLGPHLPRQWTADTAAASLARIFVAMKPAEAARVLQQLDELSARRVLLQMTERKAAPILAAMPHDRAAALALLLLQARPHE